MKKTTSKKNPKKTVKSVKRGKPKVAAIIENTNIDNNIVNDAVPETTPTPVVSETVVKANTIEEAIASNNNQTETNSTESIDNSYIAPETSATSPSTTQTDSVSYADITVPDHKANNNIALYIGAALAVVLFVWAFFL